MFKCLVDFPAYAMPWPGIEKWADVSRALVTEEAEPLEADGTQSLKRKYAPTA